MKIHDRAPAPLLNVLRHPAALAALDPAAWETLLRDADALRLSNRIAWDAGRIGCARQGCLGDRLDGLRVRGAESDRAIRWEFSRIAEAVRETQTTVVALKGAAYVLLDLPFARGRRVGDVDILVPRADLARVEAALVAAGWITLPLDPYDDRYYRLWTHELPPMLHERRRIPLDVHHGLVPRTSRIQPDPARVLARSHSLAGLDVRVPCPAHLVLHAAVHLFHDGEITGALRDLVDIDGLLGFYGRSPAFWNDFCGEAEILGVQRAAFYAVRYARRMLETPVPSETVAAIEEWTPRKGMLAAMDHLVCTALTRTGTANRTVAAAVLRARAHWLRMPPGLLARHLAVKSVRRWQSARPA
jgi:hypothetical protein